MFVLIFLMGCDQKEEPKPKVIRTSFGYDCIKEGPGAVTCWPSEGPPPK